MLVKVDSWSVSATMIGGLDNVQLEKEHLIILHFNRGGEEEYFMLQAGQAEKLALRVERFAEWADKIIHEQSGDYAQTITNEDIWFKPLCYVIVDAFRDRRVHNCFGGVLEIDKGILVSDFAWALRQAVKAAREKRKVEFESGSAVTLARLADETPPDAKLVDSLKNPTA